LKTSFTGFWRRNLAFFRLAVLTNLEYRFNFLTDAVLQPVTTALIELTLWTAVFAAAQTETIGGFGRESYLAYVLWTAFVGRIAANWMYEFRMSEEVESGTINSLLVRPTSFYESYLSQFLGYKFVVSSFSLVIPLLASLWFRLPLEPMRLLPALALIIYYLVLMHTVSFVIATLAFHLSRIHSITVAKNLALWLITGELIPLDLFPEGIRNVVLWLPFASGVYIPVGYLTGRISEDLLYRGFLTTTLGIAFFGVLGAFMWKWGLSKYTGTGA
jgi:ABC-2 type transport system permease protein